VPLAEDFGPPNIAAVYKFCRRLDHYLTCNAQVCCYVRETGAPCTNVIFLLGVYLVLHRNQEPQTVMGLFEILTKHILFYVDASKPPCTTFTLSLFDCWSALQKAKQHKFIDLSKFNCKEYEHWEKPENGDLNWIIPKKLLAFASPDSITPPSFYIPYFKANGVTTIIRLNSEFYSSTDFTQKGFEHFDLVFPDGHAPSLLIVAAFLDIVKRPNAVVAVHCKKGLGRTGTLNACYIMKYYNFTAKEAIAYIRIMRPGSILGIQQHFLASLEGLRLQNFWEENSRNKLTRSSSLASNNDLLPFVARNRQSDKTLEDLVETKHQRRVRRSKQFEKRHKC